jgi:hypothetical protein
MTDEFPDELFGKRTLKFYDYKIVDDYVIKCRTCEKDLINVIVKAQDEHSIKMQFLCPFCGDKSFVHEICGKVQLGSCEGVLLGGIESCGDVEVMRCYKNE